MSRAVVSDLLRVRHDCSLPGSSAHGILQARKLGWVAISCSRGSSNPAIKPRSPADSLSSVLPGKPRESDVCNEGLTPQPRG